ncbi:MAG TPA: hypothetical protein VG309_02610 [Rhizomicrobium sp.]|jgi:hypothetical protein|nr:hypothetical protein [Rhizomicrobium sp.]
MIKGWSAAVAVRFLQMMLMVAPSLHHAGPKEDVFAADRASSQLSSPAKKS